MSINCCPHKSVVQDWVSTLPFMQQAVVLAALRGPDGVDKNHAAKALIRFYRRSVVLIAFTGEAYNNPLMPGGGSYTGPSAAWETNQPWENLMAPVVQAYISSMDSLPHHYHLHFLHGCEILGYKHGDGRIRAFWLTTYYRLCKDMHLHVETPDELDDRLNDNEATWRSREYDDHTVAELCDKDPNLIAIRQRIPVEAGQELTTPCFGCEKPCDCSINVCAECADKLIERKQPTPDPRIQRVIDAARALVDSIATRPWFRCEALTPLESALAALDKEQPTDKCF